MTTKRTELYGKARYGTERTCGHDGGYDDHDTCGAPATFHGWPGEPPDKPDPSGVVYSCEKHFTIISGTLWDYHRIGPACGIPESRWYNGTEQGQGCCRHELDLDTLHISLTESLRSTT